MERPTAPSQSGARSRSGVIAKRPTAISGTTATAKPAIIASNRFAPARRATPTMSHGTSAARIVVNTCAALGFGAVPPPIALAT